MNTLTMESVRKDAAARGHLPRPEGFVEFPITECYQPIHRRFEKQVTLRPKAPAVRLPARDIPYAELNAAANQAARMLLATVRTDARPIALILDQGYEAVFWTLAVLKAGLCYAPLDYRLPESVLRSLMENLRPGVLIAGSRHEDTCRRLGASGFPVMSAGAVRDRFAAENLDCSVAGESIAHVFYTSGSTGKPKGVADSHRNVLHNIQRYTNSLKFSPGDILSLVQNPSFSGTVSSLFGALLNGATIAPFDLQSEGLERLSQWVRRAQITVFHAVPSIFRQLSDAFGRFPHIRLVRLEGDRASAWDVRHFRANFQDDCTLVNGLGATECGLVSQFFINKDSHLDMTETVPVGYAVPDMAVRVVDAQGVTLPAGSPGEIVVESRFLATGYWRNPELTAARFETPDDDLRRYRTGDLGRMDDDGCLIHLGRIDQRIRIAGEFVDTADIEMVLRDLPGISQGVVRDFADRFGERKLCAYVVADGDSDLTVDRLREAMSERMAKNAIPTAFVFLDALPLTKDLKVDYRSLPQPGRQRPPLLKDYVAPQTQLEEQMARIWSEVLDIDPVGVNDSLFDLGGDSLHAARIVSRVLEQFEARLPLKSLFQSPTIAAMAALITEQRQRSSAERTWVALLDEFESLPEEKAHQLLRKSQSKESKH